MRVRKLIHECPVNVAVAASGRGCNDLGCVDRQKIVSSPIEIDRCRYSLLLLRLCLFEVVHGAWNGQPCLRFAISRCKFRQKAAL
jgi:hypothetical protein